MKAEAWGMITPDGLLCKNLVRESQQAVIEAEEAMFPELTDWYECGFRVRKLNITWEDETMDFGKVTKYDIKITPTDNGGFIANVGCGIFAFSNKEDAKKAFGEFLDNADEFEKRYMDASGAMLTGPPLDERAEWNVPEGLQGQMDRLARWTGSHATWHEDNPTTADQQSEG